jgi:integrase
MTTRRATGGMIRQHPARGLWEARYVGADGCKHSLYAKTRAAAQERLRAALTAADNGIRPVRDRATVSGYLDEWVTTVGAHVRPRTAESYASTVRLYIAPTIGSIQLAKLQPEDIGRMMARLKVRGDLSPTTIKYGYVVLRIALGEALRSKRVVRNVALEVRAPRASRTERTPLTLAQVATFLDHVGGDRLEALYMTAIGLGLRSGELLALRWSDVDLEAATLAVRHTRNVMTGELAKPKTERSRRTLRLGSELAGALREHRRRQVEERLAAGPRWHDEDYVFASPYGRSLDANNVRHRFQAALAAAGLPRQRLHDLRHACATLRLEQGEELAVVSRILGHASIATTADVYGHLTDAMLGRAAERTDVILGRRAASA